MTDLIEKLRARLAASVQDASPGSVIMMAKDVYGSRDPDVKVFIELSKIQKEQKLKQGDNTNAVS